MATQLISNTPVPILALRYAGYKTNINSYITDIVFQIGSWPKFTEDQDY